MYFDNMRRLQRLGKLMMLKFMGLRLSCFIFKLKNSRFLMIHSKVFSFHIITNQ